MSTGPFFNTAKERDAWHNRSKPPYERRTFVDPERRKELERLIAGAKWKAEVDAKEAARKHLADQRRQWELIEQAIAYTTAA